MRAFLQFLGFASASICGALLAGILLTTPAVADATPPSGNTIPLCVDACKCNSDEDCVQSGSNTHCQSASCECYDGGIRGPLCRPITT